MRKLLASLLLCGVAVAASAQWAQPVPSPLALAAVPGLSSEQQAGVRKILLQHRDAIDALASKERAEFEALQQRSRAERERADDATDASLRKLLGDEGYRKFAEWHLAQRDAHGPRRTACARRPAPGYARRTTAAEWWRTNDGQRRRVTRSLA